MFIRKSLKLLIALSIVGTSWAQAGNGCDFDEFVPPGFEPERAERQEVTNVLGAGPSAPESMVLISLSRLPNEVVTEIERLRKSNLRASLRRSHITDILSTTSAFDRLSNQRKIQLVNLLTAHENFNTPIRDLYAFFRITVIREAYLAIVGDYQGSPYVLRNMKPPESYITRGRIPQVRNREALSQFLAKRQFIRAVIQQMGVVLAEHPLYNRLFNTERLKRNLISRILGGAHRHVSVRDIMIQAERAQGHDRDAPTVRQTRSIIVGETQGTALPSEPHRMDQREFYLDTFRRAGHIVASYIENNEFFESIEIPAELRGDGFVLLERRIVSRAELRSAYVQRKIQDRNKARRNLIARIDQIGIMIEVSQLNPLTYPAIRLPRDRVEILATRMLEEFGGSAEVDSSVIEGLLYDAYISYVRYVYFLDIAGTEAMGIERDNDADLYSDYIFNYLVSFIGNHPRYRDQLLRTNAHNEVEMTDQLIDIADAFMRYPSEAQAPLHETIQRLLNH